MISGFRAGVPSPISACHRRHVGTLIFEKHKSHKYKHTMEKFCTECKKKLDIDCFFNNKATTGEKKYPSTRCKSCHNLKRRENKLVQVYGITVEQYDELFRRQNGKCAICSRPPKTRRLHVDHCHRTKIVRGLLCYNCNYGLSWFKDNPQFLLKASKYLTIHGGV